MSDSFKKFPAELAIKPIVSSILGQEVSAYFVSGVMNKKQFDTLKGKINIHFDHQIEDDKWVVSTIITHQQLEGAAEAFKHPSKEWRGQYYVIANRFLDACKPYLPKE